jgi:hypothetical protein
MLARALDNAGLARQQRAQILKSDLAGQQRDGQRTETDFCQPLPRTHVPAHATPLRNAKRPSAARSRGCGAIFY